MSDEAAGSLDIGGLLPEKASLLPPVFNENFTPGKGMHSSFSWLMHHSVQGRRSGL